jgi:hypothetical protein
MGENKHCLQKHPQMTAIGFLDYANQLFCVEPIFGWSKLSNDTSSKLFRCLSLRSVNTATQTNIFPATAKIIKSDKIVPIMMQHCLQKHPQMTAIGFLDYANQLFCVEPIFGWSKLYNN